MRGELINNSVLVEGKDVDKLFNKFYGSREGKKLYLSLVEAAYLIYKSKLQVYKGDEVLEFDQFLKIASKLSNRFITKFFVYRDMRERGYILKTALKYGADFRVYEKGSIPGREHSKWILFAVNQDEEFLWQKFASMVRVAHSVKKNLLIGIVDSENEVTYYEVSWIKP